MPVFLWSQDPATNATVDPSINLAAGRSPSSITPADRATLSAIAKWRDDISGGTVTTGTSTAYILNTFSVFDTAAHLSNQMVAFTPHATNGAGPVTMTLDSIANIPLRSAPNTELLAGTLIEGTPYVCRFNQSDNALYLMSFFGNAYNIPLGGMIDYTGATAPNSSFVLPFGQAISRTTYSTYFSLVGTTYGAGDGSTTYNVPDLRGRYVAGWDAMGGASAGRLTSASGVNGDTFAAVGGENGVTLRLTDLPAGITSDNTAAISLVVESQTSVQGLGATPTGAGGVTYVSGTQLLVSTGTLAPGAVPVTSNNTGGTVVPNAPPTIVLSKILRII